MNNVDWGMYDIEDKKPVKSSINKKKSIEEKPKNVDWDLYDPAQENEKSYLEKGLDFGKTLLKGAVEGVGQLGRIMGPLETGKSTSQQLEEQTEFLEEKLPSEENFVSSSLRRGLKEAPIAIASLGGAGALPRSLLAGFFGQGAKELGLPEWAQSAAEITAYIGPDITKKLLEKGSNAQLIQEARKLGISDNQLAPLLNSEFKQKWLTKLSPKRGTTQKALSSTKEQLQSSYKAIQKSETSTLPISKQAEEGLSKGIFTAFEEMPAEVRGLVEKDFIDLLNKPITGESLMNFYADVNHNLGPSSKQLSLLKKPVKEAIQSISPQLGKDFNLINDLYSKYYTISSRLKPDLVSDLISAGEALGLGTSIVLGHYPSLLTILTEKSAKKLAQQMLINPRFQQIGSKFVDALNQNKFTVAKKLMDSLGLELKKDFPEVYDLFKSIKKDDFDKLTSQK